MKIIGHKKQWEFLKKQFLVSRVPHALLFSGEESLGKKRVAFEFLKLLNCENTDLSKRPCQVCQSCKAMEKRIHPDFFFIKPENGTIGIPQIRRLSESLILKSYFQWKTGILDQAHSMTREAQNCLLKTLEEPSGKTCLILISEHSFLLFPTILSRVQEVKFFPVKRRMILNYLINLSVEEKKAQEIAEFSFGRPGQAIEFALNPKKFKDDKLRIEDFLLLFERDLAFRFHHAETLSSTPKDLGKILNLWSGYLRQVLISDVSKRDFKKVKKIKRILEQVAQVQFLMSTRNINKRLALENLFLNI